jgi:DNA-binding NtrC family response regulator
LINLKSLANELIDNHDPPFRPRILIVEDHADTRALWAQVLRTIGTITEASTAREAMDEIRDGDVNILILDWKLNGNAEAILDAWIHTDPTAPVCVISGALELLDVDALYQRGVHTVLLKPIGVGAVVEVVRRYALRLEAAQQIECLQGKVHRLRLWVYSLATIMLLSIGERGLAMLKQPLP